MLKVTWRCFDQSAKQLVYLVWSDDNVKFPWSSFFIYDTLILTILHYITSHYILRRANADHATLSADVRSWTESCSGRGSDRDTVTVYKWLTACSWTLCRRTPFDELDRLDLWNPYSRTHNRRHAPSLYDQVKHGSSFIHLGLRQTEYIIKLQTR